MFCDGKNIMPPPLSNEQIIFAPHPKNKNKNKNKLYFTSVLQ